MDDKEKMKIIRLLWLITDIIILIVALYLFIFGDTSDRIIAVIGFALIIIEAILYKQKKILQ